MRYRYFPLYLFFLTTLLFSQEVPQFAPLTKKEWKECETFIQEKADNYFQKGIFLISSQKDLPYPVEKDPTTGLIFIHLKDHPKGYLGRGGNKIVSKSILYSHRAFVVARCEANKTGKIEAEVLSKLQHVRGVDHIYASIQRDENHSDIFIEYANKGTLCKAPYGKIRLSNYSILSIFYDLSAGIDGIHKNGYIHRDIKRTNTFLYKKEGTYHGMIGDFGCAIPIDALPNIAFCISNENTPPEIYQKPFCQINRIQADTYSLGVLFYMLVFHKRPPWQKYIRKGMVRSLSSQSKQQRLVTIEKTYLDTIQKAKKNMRGTQLKIATITLDMLHPNPNKRPLLIEVQKQVKELME